MQIYLRRPKNGIWKCMQRLYGELLVFCLLNLIAGIATYGVFAAQLSSENPNWFIAFIMVIGEILILTQGARMFWGYILIADEHIDLEAKIAELKQQQLSEQKAS